jgi:hypothetical protein
MKSTQYILFLALLVSGPVFAQLGMGGQPHASAALDVKATNKAFYPPRLTTVQRKAISNPQAGAFVYDLDQNTMFLYDGENWMPIALQNPTGTMPTSRVAADGVVGDRFGCSVALSGDFAFVGARDDDAGKGSVYLYIRSGNIWQYLFKLTAPDGVAGDGFGESVALSGDHAFVGAPADDSGKGAVYWFKRTGNFFSYQAKFTASDGVSGDNFGISVAIAGNYALVGAYADDLKGSAYWFNYSGTTWVYQSKLLAPDGASGDWFGVNVSLSATGDYALIGAPKDAPNGSAYVFVQGGGTYTFQQKLVPDAAAGRFGTSLAVSGDYAFVGAPFSSVNAGQVYVFRRSGSNWNLTETFVNASSGADSFGNSLSLSGSYLLVGDSDDRINGIKEGSVTVYRFDGTNWQPAGRRIDITLTGNNNGLSISISNGSFVMGGSGFESNKGRVAFGTVNQ